MPPPPHPQFNEGRPGGGLYFSLIDGRSFTKAASHKHRDAFQQEVYAVHRRGDAVYITLAPLSAAAVRHRAQAWRRGMPAGSPAPGRSGRSRAPTEDQDPEGEGSHAAGVTVGSLAAVSAAAAGEEGPDPSRAEPHRGRAGVPRLGRSRSLPRDHLDLRFSGDEEDEEEGDEEGGRVGVDEGESGMAASLPPPDMAASDGEAGGGTRLREAWFIHSWRRHGASSDSYDLVLRRYPHSVRPRTGALAPSTGLRRGRRRRRTVQRPFLWHVTLEAPARAIGRARPVQR